MEVGVPQLTHGDDDEQDNRPILTVDDEEGEVFPLIKEKGASFVQRRINSANVDDRPRRLNCRGSCMAVLFGTVILVCIVWSNRPLLLSHGTTNKEDSSSSSLIRTPPQLICPPSLTETTQNPHQELHRSDDQYILQNLSDYQQHFHTLQFDAWDATFDEYKEAMRGWKLDLLNQLLQGRKNHDDETSHRNSHHHDSFDTNNEVWVYESASGIGLNLYLTTEIWNQATSTTSRFYQQRPLNVTVFGNDYVKESVDVAQYLWKTVPPLGGQYGKMCNGDSTLLHQWVQPNTFDVVFTGFVTPLHDPLQLGLSDYELDRHYAVLCNSTDPTDEAQVHLLQERQNDWFANWTSEMLRIARPGGIVAVEMISYPTCDDLDEWGGVAPDWWTNVQTSIRYNWPVDSTTIVVQPELVLPGNRYHVRMQKTVL